MKLNRMRLRRLIESVINEVGPLGPDDENPGSKFSAAKKRGEITEESLKERLTQELQKTYDWFDRVVFPAIEENRWPIVVDDDYYFPVGIIGRLVSHGSFRSTGEIIEYLNDADYLDDSIDKVMKKTTLPKGKKIESLDHNLLFPGDGGAGEYSLAEIYHYLESVVVRLDLRVTIQSEQPTEFEEAVEGAKKNQKPVNGELNESRGSLYRKRYRRY